ncbi:MAG: phosphatase PAP2 family protein [Corynebacterium sp.]|nr:phosphatase PAP2 family protein [Corynebacterium sp.]
MNNPLDAIAETESHILEAIQSVAFDVPGVVTTARGLSHFGEHALGWMALSALGAAVDAPRRRGWVAVGAASFASHAASVVVKRIVRRKRPDFPYVRVGVKTPSKLSFPSSHSTSTTAFLVAVAQLTGHKWVCVGIPVMMASRMVLGVHYPSDTALGAALGAATAQVVGRYERKTA